MNHTCHYSRDRVPWRFIAFLFFSFATIAYATNSFSQNYYSGNRTYPTTNHGKYLLLNEVNRHAARHFRDNFSTDGTENWLRDQHYLVASFSHAEVNQKVYYTDKGAFKCVEKTYAEGNLSRELKSTIHKKFEGYYIKAVIEISDLEKSIYFIKIVSPNYIKTLKYQEGKLEVTENFINGGV